jgi:RNA-binding protein YlmH
MSLFDHFHKDEHPFVERVLEMIRRVEDRMISIRTDFLDPGQLFIVQSLVKRSPGVFFSFSGGYDGAERVRVILYPEYQEPEPEDFGIKALEVAGNGVSFLTLDHRDYLGSLLGLGIRREKCGDILVHEGFAQILLGEEIFEYVRLHLTKVHKVSVEAKEIPLNQIQPVTKKGKTMTFTVQSPRLDAILGDAFRISRAKVLQPIRNGQVKVNWRTFTDPSHLLKQGDIISFKGFGRFEVVSLGQETRKGRIPVEIFLYGG